MTTIEALITRLVQEAPVLDAAVISELTGLLRAHGGRLAVAIAQVVELVGARAVDAGIALPPLAMACATLVDARLTETEREAARYEIETLLPVPTPRAPVAAPDVPLAQLTRGPRPRT